MNEINLVLLGLVVLIIGLVVLLFLNEPEIFVDKEVEVIIALGIGLLILVLDRRADSKIHQMIHKQYELIDEIHRKLHEQHELIKRMQDTS